MFLSSSVMCLSRLLTDSSVMLLSSLSSVRHFNAIHLQNPLPPITNPNPSIISTYLLHKILFLRL
ncbi:unnamed protein product [Meloidogyne enterolobii]|uniref:Uncharacterized protein n=1 Tax=Meloidogyne enterolobii TaxID=390850 RepID=A0ACB0ZAH6_MELEN